VQALVRLNAILSDPRMQQTIAALREEDPGLRAETADYRVH
jgi:hypothetical protein